MAESLRISIADNGNDKKISGQMREGRMEEGVRINKYLSEAGICSRREADRQIAAGNVTIDGTAAQTGSRVMPGQEVLFLGRPAVKEEEKILLVVHKPEGIVCTAEKREKNNIVDFIRYPKRIYPVGRLDKDSSGLIFMTNQGEIVNKMMRAGNMHEREYVVTVNRPITEPFLRGISGGVPLIELGVTTRACKVKKLGSRTFKIILTQGYNRQIRRMCEYFGYRVERLERVRIMNISLGDLAPGAYRSVTEDEYRQMLKMLAKSTNLPTGQKKEQKNGYQTRNRRIKKTD